MAIRKEKRESQCRKTLHLYSAIPGLVRSANSTDIFKLLNKLYVLTTATRPHNAHKLTSTYESYSTKASS